MTRLMLTLFLLFSVPDLASGDEQVNHWKLQGLGHTRYHLLDSEQLGHPLHIFVRSPEVTGSNRERKFPVVYLLDGGINFPLLSAYYHLLRLGEEIPEMVLVGISYGSDRFADGNYRSSDFTAPAEGRDWWGKAGEFQAVLKNELFPLIESAYPADGEQRILFGQSLGGQFVLYTALTDPSLFHGLIASNPALHRNLPFFLEWKGEEPAPHTATRLFVALAENDDERFRVPANQWAEQWGLVENKPWELKIQILDDQTHLSAVPMAFRQGLLWLFGK